jgi:hypothetical protein
LEVGQEEGGHAGPPLHEDGGRAKHPGMKAMRNR